MFSFSSPLGLSQITPEDRELFLGDDSWSGQNVLLAIYYLLGENAHLDEFLTLGIFYPEAPFTPLLFAFNSLF